MVTSRKSLEDMGVRGGINSEICSVAEVEPGSLEPRRGLSDTRLIIKTRQANPWAKAELFRAELDRILEWDQVPDVYEVAREEGEQVAPGHSSFAMRWVDDSGFGGPARQLGWAESLSKLTPGQKDSIMRIFLLDMLTGNGDRHAGNFVVDDDNDKVWAIDNSFGVVARQDPSERMLAYAPANFSEIEEWDREAIRTKWSADLETVFGRLPKIKRSLLGTLGVEAAHNFGLNIMELRRGLRSKDFMGPLR
jgi:hypothetical protein